MTRKEWFGEAEVAAEGLLLRCGREVVSDTANRQEMEFPGVLPLCNLPEELQLIVAALVAAPRDRAALCLAVPPLGRKALKEIEAYQVPLMSLGFRVLSGGAVSEAEVRVFVRNFAPSEAAHPPLALNEYTQLNAMAAPSARVRCVVQETGIEWRLASGALLRCWKRNKGEFYNEQTANMEALGMHHYEGVAGAERLVRVAFADGEVLDYRVGERGAELLWAQWMPRADSPGYYKCRGIDGWWDSGFWHPARGSPTWRMTGRFGDMCPPEQ